jgi:hypothetical protein
MHREERTFHECVEKLVIVCGRAMIHLLDNPIINVITALQTQQQQHPCVISLSDLLKYDVDLLRCQLC